MLLAFMSSWDRAAVLEDYAARLDGAEDPAALMRELGTPTRVAYLLAQSYVPTPEPGTAPTAPPAAPPQAPEPEPVPAEEPQSPEPAPAEEAPPNEEEAPKEPPKLEDLLEELSMAEFLQGLEEDAERARQEAEAEAAAKERAAAEAAKGAEPEPTDETGTPEFPAETPAEGEGATEPETEPVGTDAQNQSEEPQEVEEQPPILSNDAPEVEDAGSAASPQPEEPQAPEAEGPQTEAPPAREKTSQTTFGGVLAFLGLSLIPGLPVMALLALLGVPFMGLGVFGAVWFWRLSQALLPGFALWSDSLLLLGCGLTVLAVCLLLFWLGLWITLSFCRLWIREAYKPWARRYLFGRKEG